MKKLLLVVAGVAVLAGCSKTSDYKPEVGASGEDIFKAACASCHEVNDKGNYFDLSKDISVKDKIAKGSFSMPAFPYIIGDELESLNEYVLANSATQ